MEEGDTFKIGFVYFTKYIPAFFLSESTLHFKIGRSRHRVDLEVLKQDITKSLIHFFEMKMLSWNFE